MPSIPLWRVAAIGRAAGAVTVERRMEGEPTARPMARCCGPTSNAAMATGEYPERYGVIAIATGLSPTLIGLRAVLVAVRIGVTVPEKLLTT